MSKESFIWLLSDAIQFHEGWQPGSVSVINNNPGNLKFAGQLGATGQDVKGFAVFPDFQTGKQALVNDITAKIDAGLLSINAIISKYESGDVSNDAPAYIQSVVDFFNWFNWPVTADMTIEQMGMIPGPQCLIDLNCISEPADWHLAMQSITSTASYCAGFTPVLRFVTRYTNTDLSTKTLAVNPTTLGLPVSTVPYLLINEVANQNLLAQVSEGQQFNLLIYNMKSFNQFGLYYGGCVWEGIAVTAQAKVTAFGQVSYGPVLGVSPISRDIFHELIHAIYALLADGTGDNLHAFLNSHGGYGANLLTDLLAVYGSAIAQYNMATIQIAEDSSKVNELEGKVAQ